MNEINLRVVKVKDSRGKIRFRFRRGAWDISKEDLKSYNHLILEFQPKITEKERNEVLMNLSHKKLSIKGIGEVSKLISGLGVGGF